MSIFLPEGHTLENGKYTIRRFIASGGFGCTYEASCRDIPGKRFAIKEFFVKTFCERDDMTYDVQPENEAKQPLYEKLRGKFLNEAQSLFNLNNPGIVRIYSIFREHNTAYFVMDYIDGESLSDKIKNGGGSLGEEEALRYIRRVAMSLGYVHDNGILHLDIKPDNILVGKDDSPILIDFGVSKQYEEESGENTSSVLGLTPGYSPPEQHTNKITKFSAATDIYALGATLYKMLSGEAPPSVIDRYQGAEIPEITGKGISYGTSLAIESSLRLDKSKRPQTVEEFLQLLDTPMPENRLKQCGDSGKMDVGTDEITVVAYDEPTKSSNSANKTKRKQDPETEKNSDGHKPELNKRLGQKHSGFKWQMAVLSLVLLAIIAVAVLRGCTTNISQSDLAITGYADGNAYVDLGLPSGTKWAVSNLGATHPRDIGLYIDPDRRYRWSEEDSVYFDIAHDQISAKWAVPSQEQMSELIGYCDRKWCKCDGQYGMLFTGPNGNKMFMSAACIDGYDKNRDSDLSECKDGFGSYWAFTPDDHTRYYLFFDDDDCGTMIDRSFYSRSVRPVVAGR